MTEIKFAKLHKDAKIPCKRDEDAGYDIYPAFDEDYLLLPPHKTILVPTGLCCAFDRDYVLLLEERGSTGSKGLKRSAGVIDSSYRGEIFVAITNTNNNFYAITKADKVPEVPETCTIYPYEKAICQGLLLPCITANVSEVTIGEIQALTSERGAGKLGSSNK